MEVETPFYFSQGASSRSYHEQVVRSWPIGIATFIPQLRLLYLKNLGGFGIGAELGSVSSNFNTCHLFPTICPSASESAFRWAPGRYRSRYCTTACTNGAWFDLGAQASSTPRNLTNSTPIGMLDTKIPRISWRAICRIVTQKPSDE